VTIPRSSGRARRTDPATSHEAAERLTADKLTAVQARVLQMFRLYGDMPDALLVKYLNEMERQAGMKPTSPSGARSRRNELAKPNMERLDAIAAHWHEVQPLLYQEKTFAEMNDTQQRAARQQLRTEGFRSPLWDTGRRVKIDSSNVIVWGLAV
jgi:hypothetical protein